MCLSSIGRAKIFKYPLHYTNKQTSIFFPHFHSFIPSLYTSLSPPEKPLSTFNHKPRYSRTPSTPSSTPSNPKNFFNKNLEKSSYYHNTFIQISITSSSIKNIIRLKLKKNPLTFIYQEYYSTKTTYKTSFITHTSIQHPVHSSYPKNILNPNP